MVTAPIEQQPVRASMRSFFEKRYSLGEEIAHAITHGIGAALSVSGMSILLVYAAEMGDPWRITSFAIYGASLFLLYLSSTLYHSLPNPKAKKFFKLMDHVSIYLLIAGTYTPFVLVTLRDNVGWLLFSIVWSLAVVGILIKIFAIGRFQRLSVLAYIGMGWVCIFVFDDIVRSIPTGGLWLMVAGGLSYTIGVIFYLWHRLPYHHAIWHLFVLGGSITHFFAILYYVLPADV